MWQIISYVSILGIVIFLNVRAWNMTRAELFVDPINWGGAAIVVVIAILLSWKKKG